MLCECGAELVSEVVDLDKWVRGNRETYQVVGYRCSVCGYELLDGKEVRDVGRQAQVFDTFDIPVGSFWKHKAKFSSDLRVVEFDGRCVYCVQPQQLIKWGVRRFLAQHDRKTEGGADD